MNKTRAAITMLVIAGFFSIDSIHGLASAAVKPRVGVLALRGAGEGVVREKITAALKANGFLVVGTEQLESSASGLGVSLDSDNGLRAVAKELNVSAFVSGELSKKKAALTVRNGADGAVLGDDSFAGANPKKIAAVVGSTFWRQLGPAVRQGKPPAGAKTKSVVAEQAPPPAEEASSEEAAAPPPAEERPRKRAKTSAPAEAEAAPPPEETVARAKPSAPAEEESEGEALPALTLGIGATGVNRSFSWNDDRSGTLNPYSLGAGPEASVWVEAYPAAFSGSGVASRIGVFGGFNQGFGVNSKANGGMTTLSTSFQDYLAGLKFRYPVGMFAPHLSAAYGAQAFKLTTTSGTAPMIPSVGYKFLRFGLGSRADFSPQVSADLGFAFMLLTDAGKGTGEIKSASYFPGTTGYAADVTASVAYRFTKIIGARVGIDFRQYGLTANPASGASLVAGGATDRFIFFGGGVELVLDGVSGAVADDEKEPAAPAKAAKSAPAEEESGGDEQKEN